MIANPLAGQCQDVVVGDDRRRAEKPDLPWHPLFPDLGTRCRRRLHHPLRQPRQVGSLPSALRPRADPPRPQSRTILLNFVVFWMESRKYR